MKFTTALLAAVAASTASSAIISTATALTVSPTVSPTPNTSIVRSTASAVQTTTAPSTIAPTDPSYPPPTGSPGPYDTQVDAVVSALKSNVLQINAKYNATCAKGCNATHIQAWGDEHAAAVNAVIVKIQAFPVGYVYWWYPQLVWNLGWIWIEIYYSLWYIWGRAGLIWEVVYFNLYLYNFYYSWRNLFWYFGRFGGYCFWPYWYGYFYRYYWGWGYVWWTWWRVFWWW
ncbi:hypothetical protein TWF694_003239 [Orbilia ellipsospora]|uniref:Uncharacterized protein n=1 Tax=Orbilia ellipsospora TaxID=2528407 RepID=A0AAV9X3I2_9PEZI